MRDTNLLEKVVPSIINVGITFLISVPFLLYFGLSFEWKICVILIFYIVQIFDTHETFSFQCFGMRVFGTVWERRYSRFQRNIYSILYTASFSTLFFYIYVPFDLFIFNMLLLQLPSVLITGTTLHGLLSGNMRTKKLV